MTGSCDDVFCSDFFCCGAASAAEAAKLAPPPEAEVSTWETSPEAPWADPAARRRRFGAGLPAPVSPRESSAWSMESSDALPSDCCADDWADCWPDCWAGLWPVFCAAGWLSPLPRGTSTSSPPMVSTALSASSFLALPSVELPLVESLVVEPLLPLPLVAAATFAIPWEACSSLLRSGADDPRWLSSRRRLLRRLLVPREDCVSSCLV